MKKRRFLSWILTLAMLFSMAPTTALAVKLPSTYDAVYDAANLEAATLFEDGKTYRLTGTGTTPVKIGAGKHVTIVLDGVTIQSATSPIQVEAGAQLTLIPKNNTENNLTCTSDTVQRVADNNAGGLTAGISVPENATLIIDKDDDAGEGTLNVTGGYGGAGIGSSAKTTLHDNLRGNSGTDGTLGSLGHDYAQISGSFGTGGQGGRYGTDTQNAGTITINGSILNVTGGTGSAGIGGGLGGAGETGGNGHDGKQGQAGTTWDYNRRIKTCGASGGSGAGGNGGNGGSGGSGGSVNITGGRITVEGGTGAAGIGGGAGGTGGAGGAGGKAIVGKTGARRQAGVNGWNDAFYTCGTGGAGGAGAGGYGGRGGRGGNAGTLNILGGYVSARGAVGFGPGAAGVDGRKGSGNKTNGSIGESSYVEWSAHNDWGNRVPQGNGTYIYWNPGNGLWCYYGTATTGGNGGAAGAQAQANSDGAAGTMQITNSNANVDFVSTGGGALTNASPTDKNNDPLYRVELTIYDLDKNSKIKDANVNVTVPASSGKAEYTYKTVSENNGKAVLWLPAGEYTLSEKAVNHATLGAIPKDSPVTLTVAANNDNKQDVMIGVSVKVSADKTDKVYFSTDDETPVTIRVDTSDVKQTIDSVKWFRETVNNNPQEYAPENNGNKKSFDDGYKKIADASGNKGTLTNPTDKVYSLPINQNGRYWVQVEYVSNGVEIKLVKGLTVNNIYRTFDIKFRSEWWETFGQNNQGKRLVSSIPTGDDNYGPLLDSQGKESRQQVGFAWELNGYKADDITKGTLLIQPKAGFDRVKFYAQSSQLSYNSAVLGTHTFTKDPLFYEKTLNPAFLSDKNHDCYEKDGVRDYSKYTLTYEPKDSDLTIVTIYGRVQKYGAVDATADPLYTSQRAYSPHITDDNIAASKWTGYKLVGVKINGKDAAFVKDDQNNDTNVVALTNIQGTVDTDKIRTVEFIYENNMTDVTIRGYYQGTTKRVFDDRTVSVELGTSFTYPQPVIDGYSNAGADPADGKLAQVAKGDIITFYYLKAAGNVTYQAVDRNGNTLLSSKTIRVGINDQIDVSEIKANNVIGNIPYYKLDGPGKANYTSYNGKDDVTVTYTYTRKTHSLTVVKKDVDNGNDITGAAQTINQVPAGQSYVFKTNEVTTPNGYTPVTALNPAAYSMEDADGQTVFWYRKNDTNRIATVTVECLCDEDGKGEKVFKTYQIPAIKDVKLPVAAPQWKGYILKPNTESSKDITPTGNATYDTVQFHYVLDDPRTITVKLQDTAGTALPAPLNYPDTYRIKKGGTVYIQAPVINGYSLKSSASILTVSYNTVIPGDTVTFQYESVSSAEFVTHTVKFQLDNTDIYQYEKPVPRGTGTTKYDETSVQMVVPGYKLLNIELQSEGSISTNPNSVDAPNDKNATIIYHFAEDAAEIVIKQTCTTPTNAGGHGTQTQKLTGYRVGQEGIVILAPPFEGHALATGQPSFKQLNALQTTNEVEFKYDGLGEIVFELYEYDSPGVASTVIQRINGTVGRLYDPKVQNNPLDLTSIGYTFFPCNDASVEFQENGDQNVTLSAGKKTYKVYYKKMTRPVQFYAIDSAKYPKPANMNDFSLTNAQQQGAVINGSNGSGETLTHETARVAETYKASAMNIDFYALQDDPSKYYYVEKTTDPQKPLEVYFWYRAKGQNEVTVQYQADSTTIMSYSASATKGEKLVLKAPQYLENGKYVRATDQAAEITVTADAAKTVTLKYQPNFVNVTVQTVTDGGSASNDGTYQVNKTDDQGTLTGNLSLIPPYKPGYTLVGIEIGAEGSQNSFPAAYNKVNGKLNLTGLQADTTVIYYYQTTKASEYQGRIKIQYQYRGYDLADPKTDEPVNLGESNRIDIPSIDGYTAQSYTFVNGTGSTTSNEAIPEGGLQITPTAATGLTLTIHYTRTDGTIVLPGGDQKIPAPADKDNVIVKPDPAKPPTIDGNGNVTIKPDDNNASVIRPIDPNKPDQGKEEIKVPGGTVISPDGTITLPEPQPSGTTITPDTKLPEGLPQDSDYIVITYHANNGTGESKKELGKKDELTVKDNTFAGVNGAKFLSWNEQSNGQGIDYAVNRTVSQSVTLYALWYQQGADGSIELPGKDGAIAAPNDKDNVIVTPDPNGTLNGPNQPDGSVKVEKGDATVTRPDPNDPNFPQGGKEEIKVPDGSIIYPDGTIKLPDGTIINPGDKLPDKVISNTYAIVTYDPNGGSGNVIRQMVKKNEVGKALSGDVFTAPRGMIFEQWKNVTEDKTIAAGGDFKPTKDLTLRAQWKEKAQTPTSYTAQIVFVSNTNDGTTHTQTITGINSKLITGQLAAYADHFTEPSNWKFMGWSTIKAASRHATVYADSATVTLKEGTTLKLYAILYQVDENTKVVTLPGADGQPEGTDNVTVTPPAGTDIALGNGYVEAPKGSEITQPAGKIKVMGGTVIVYPDGSIYVPDGSQVKLPNGTTVNGEANIDKDGNVDKDKDKPIQKPDGTIVLPGEDKKTGTDDDIIVKPAGPNKPAGRIDEDGNVTITDPDGADVTFQGKDPENVKLPIGTVITPDGTVTLTYTLKYVDDKGKELETAELVQIKVGETERVKALSINGYNLKGEAVRNITGALRTALNDYIITFTYEKQKSDGGSGGAGGGGGSVIVIGGGGGGSSLNPQKPTIITDGNLQYTLSKDGTSASLTPNDGYEINSIIVNGEEKGGAEAITGLKTGDIVKISAICYLDVIEEAQSYKLVARSKQIKRKNGMHPVKVKVSWYDENGKELKLDGYEIERSRKRYSGYQLRFKTDREVYYNTYIENGAKYYYRVRGYILFKGEKYYTNWSKKAWRTVKM